MTSFTGGLFPQVDAGIMRGINGIGVQGGGAPAGGYHFSPEELRSILKQWRDVQDTIVEASLEPETVRQNRLEPGNEVASETAGTAIRSSLEAYMAHLSAMNTYAAKYIEALDAALRSYQNAEEAGHASFQSVRTQL